MKPLSFDSTTPALLMIFYKEWLIPRRKEWEPLSTAAADAGFLVVVATWETLALESGLVRANEAFVLRPVSAVFETAAEVVFTPAVVMTTWGTSGYYELFTNILSLGAYHSEYPLIAGLDGKCELERCLRNYEKNTGHMVSRPHTLLSEELLQDEVQINGDDFVILKPSRSGQCKGIEIVRRDSLRALAREAATGKRPPFVVQDLVDDVFLYEGRRWDIRVNVLATSLFPLKYYLYPQGIAKTTGAAANPGSIALEEWLNAESFLADSHTAENLPMTGMLDYVGRKYMPLNDFWSQIDEIVGHVFSAMALQAEQEHLPPGRSFMYPGFDFIVERGGAAGYAVRLLEINSHPGLAWEPHITSALMPQYRLWFEEIKKMV
ncbi:MAG: tubulin--tyrosine ligase family protein [Thermoanaerobaculia bacterium]|nr:tubulin--tyrosine ligase family protein [Thermoanaerobaculia bacterium]